MSEELEKELERSAKRYAVLTAPTMTDRREGLLAAYLSGASILAYALVKYDGKFTAQQMQQALENIAKRRGLQIGKLNG